MEFTTLETKNFYKFFHEDLIKKILLDIEKAKKEGKKITKAFLKEIIKDQVDRKETQFLKRMGDATDDCAKLIRWMVDFSTDECKHWQIEKQLLKDVRKIMKKEENKDDSDDSDDSDRGSITIVSPGLKYSIEDLLRLYPLPKYERKNLIEH